MSSSSSSVSQTTTDCLAAPPSPRAPEPEIFFTIVPNGETQMQISHYTFNTTVILVSTLLGLLNFAIHLSWKSQFRGLVGKKGISPAIESVQHNEKFASKLKGIFGRPNYANNHHKFIPKILPSDENMNRVVWVGMFFGFIQIFVGLLQLFFGYRRTASSSLLESSSTQLSSLISNFILGSSNSSPYHHHQHNLYTLLIQFFLTKIFFTPWFNSSICFVTYYSLRELAGRFMGLQMHAKVLELNFWFALLSFCDNSFATAFAFQFFAVRLMVGGGLGKITGHDQSWTKLGNYTAMCYHYWTMPLPNPLSRWFHHLPYYVHRMEVYLTVIVEGPLGFFSLVQPILNNYYFNLLRVLAFLGNAILLFGINISGNFGHLWLATIAASAASLDDVHLSYIFPVPKILNHGDFAVATPNDHDDNTTNYYYFSFSAILNLFVNFKWYLGILVSIYYCAVQLVPFYETYKGPLPPPFHYPLERVLRPLITNTLNSLLHLLPSSSSTALKNAASRLWSALEDHSDYFASLSLCNVYVKFANMTKFRHELIIQAKPKEVGSQWIDIPFKYKPWSADETPKFAPICHMPSLDWFLWFIPLQVARSGGSSSSAAAVPAWFVSFLEKIKDQEPAVLDLIDNEKLQQMYPFQSRNSEGELDRKPVCVRAMVYEFMYSTVSELDLESGVPNGGQIDGIVGKKVVGLHQRVGKPVVGKWWRKTQLGYQSVWEV